MNSPDSSHLRGVPALAAWVTALLLFLASLVWLVSSGMRAGNADFISGMNGQDGTASLGQNDPGAVLGNLRAQDAAPVPVLSPSSSSASSSVHKDAAESEYVLSAAGLQGFTRVQRRMTCGRWIMPNRKSSRSSSGAARPSPGS